MNRTSKITRLYKTQEYQNIEISDTIEDIPEHLFSNPEYMKTLSILQMLRLDELFYEYKKISPTFMSGITTEEALELISKVSIESLDKLNQTVKKE